MQRETYSFLKDYVSEEQLKALGTDADRVRPRMSDKTDEQRFDEEITKYKNPHLELLKAISMAEKKPWLENFKKVIHSAVMQHDFITALHWHKQKTKKFSSTVADKFECYYYTIMAEQQKHHEPTAEPYTSVKQMCSKASDVSHALRDERYLEQTIEYETERAKVYQEKFNLIENSVLIPAKNKDGNAALIQVGIGLALLIAGGIFLWKSYGIVAAAIKSFFAGTILSLITWIIPLLYAILVIAVDFTLIYLLTKNIGKGNKKKLNKKLAEIMLELDKQLESTDAYRTLQEMNADIPQDFHSYDARLVLAALSAITGEQDVKKLCKMANDKSTWLSREMPAKTGNDPYKHIDRFLREDSSDTELFLGYTFNIKLYSEKGLSYDYYNGASYGTATFTPEDFEKGEQLETYDFIEKFIRKPFGGKNHRQNQLLIFNLAERFLLEEALLGSNLRKTGEAYYELYKICIYAKYDRLIGKANEKIYTYGRAGVDYCDEFKYYVMYNKASYEEDSGFYDPYESLGFTRADVKAYARTHPKGAELLKNIREIDERAAKREAEARKAEVRAYWEERSRLMREAEEAREKARAELNARMDSLERDANLLLNGTFATVEERIMQSNRSDTAKTMDLLRYDALREAAIRKKLDDM